MKEDQTFIQKQIEDKSFFFLSLISISTTSSRAQTARRFILTEISEHLSLTHTHSVADEAVLCVKALLVTQHMNIIDNKAYSKHVI